LVSLRLEKNCLMNGGLFKDFQIESPVAHQQYQERGKVVREIYRVLGGVTYLNPPL